MTARIATEVRAENAFGLLVHCASCVTLAAVLAATLRWGRELVSPPLTTSVFNALFTVIAFASAEAVYRSATAVYLRCGRLLLLLVSVLLAVVAGAVGTALDHITEAGDPIRVFYGPAAGLVVLFSALSLLVAFMTWLWSKADESV